MSADEREDRLRFGPFELDLSSRELFAGSRRARLQEQPFVILQMLLERRGRVVTRDELRARLWPEGTFVDFEHSLNAAVKRLRAALGDDADNPRFVETVPRRGYRFVADRKDEDARARVDGVPNVRLAVLPFRDLGDEASADHFSDGLTDEMISELGRRCRGRIGVVSSHSTMAFKETTLGAREIGAALRADYLLEGGVRRERDRFRITARLVASATDTSLWVETYEGPLGDCVAVQTDVAARIAHSLALELLPEQRRSYRASTDAIAYQAYLKGRYHWQRTADTGAMQALHFLHEAVTRDPSFIEAWAGIAVVQILRAEHYREPAAILLELARVAAERALALDPESASAHFALAEVQRLLLWDWTAAGESYRRAIALNPSYEGARMGYAKWLALCHRMAESIREADTARALDPRCLTMNTTSAWLRYVAGDYDAAVSLCQMSLEMDENYTGAQRLLGAILLANQQPKQATRTLSALVERGCDSVAVAWLAHARAVTGDRAGACGLLSTAQASGAPPSHLALAYTGLGTFDEAFAALLYGCDDRDPWIANVTLDPRFAPLRADDRYRHILGRLGL